MERPGGGWTPGFSTWRPRRSTFPRSRSRSPPPIEAADDVRPGPASAPNCWPASTPARRCQRRVLNVPSTQPPGVDSPTGRATRPAHPLTRSRRGRDAELETADRPNRRHAAAPGHPARSSTSATPPPTAGSLSPPPHPPPVGQGGWWCLPTRSPDGSAPNALSRQRDGSRPGVPGAARPIPLIRSRGGAVAERRWFRARCATRGSWQLHRPAQLPPGTRALADRARPGQPMAAVPVPRPRRHAHARFLVFFFFSFNGPLTARRGGGGGGWVGQAFATARAWPLEEDQAGQQKQKTQKTKKKKPKNKNPKKHKKNKKKTAESHGSP